MVDGIITITLKEALKTSTCLRSAFARLIKDLDERGLLDSTLVMMTSEFGRTPKIYVTGRDHWPRYSVEF